VGTGLKVDGCTWNRVDAERAQRMMDIVRSVRGG
jgi:predicted TIM-barrel enzyme